MKPYYEHGGITIFLADCREWLSAMPICYSVDLVIADPPYGMDYSPLRGADGSKRFSESIVGDEEPFSPAHLMRFPRLVLWGAHHYADRLPANPGWIVWDKTPHGRKEGFIASDVDMAWTSFLTRNEKFSLQWGGEAHGNEPHFHPTQKPVALIEWIVRRHTSPGSIVLDPYMGSGTTLMAAKNLNRRAIGIEIEEKYCAIAAKRLEQEVLTFEETVIKSPHAEMESSQRTLLEPSKKDR